MNELRELPRIRAISANLQEWLWREEGGHTEQSQSLQQHQEGVPEALGCERGTTEIFPIKDKGRYKGKDKSLSGRS